MKVREVFKIRRDGFGTKEGYYLDIDGQIGESISMTDTVEIKRDGTVIYTGKPEGIMRFADNLESFTVEDEIGFCIRFSMKGSYVPVAGDEIITV